MIIPPPVPAPTSFQTLFQDVSGYTHDLTDANAARARVRSAVRSAKRQLAAAPATTGGDWAAAHKQLAKLTEPLDDVRPQATTDYLPYLYAVLKCVETDDLLLKNEPVFIWKSSLSSQPLKKPNQRIQLVSLHAELAATLLTHAICLANHADVLVQSLGSYETSVTMTSAALKAHDETVNVAADMLCRASGVLMHLAEVVIPRWETGVGEEWRRRPVEFTRDVATALAKMFQADANLLAIRRLLSRAISVATSTTTPGPPLSSSHPSPSLLAKLHLHVFTLYDEARALVKAAPRNPDAQGEISPLLRRYLSDGRSLSQALSYKWLGVDCGENGSGDRAGDALGWLAMAKTELEQVQGKTSGLKSLKMGKGKAAGKTRKSKVAEELDSVFAFTSAYKKVNDTVHFRSVTPSSTLLLSIPAGRAALVSKAFTPPQSAFQTRGSRGSGRTGPPAVDLDLASLDVADDSSDDEESAADYFGAGQYF
ncbi:hypothetical protein OIV83_002982 [Microbotryomycetes sp. JL201]|nr:hypothetical protein OIV83_002982 [Microbotryomycetes sp. JL201]